jgi:hypothetical protein
VPYDGPASVTPWMAGGGSTVRHVPAKNSLDPFLSTDANGLRGTYALMTDGSVRYLKAGVSDAVFKAMCTVDGPTPAEFDLDSDLTRLEVPVKEEAAKKDALPPGWTVQESKDGGFMVALPPGTLVPLNEKQTLKGLGERTIKGFSSITETKPSFTVFYFDLPDDVKKQSPVVQLQSLMVAIKKELGSATIKRETAIKLAKNSGMEIETLDKEGATIVRMYLVQHRAYVLLVTGPTLSPSAPESGVATFFGSFKLKGN